MVWHFVRHSVCTQHSTSQYYSKFFPPCFNLISPLFHAVSRTQIYDHLLRITLPNNPELKQPWTQQIWLPFVTEINQAFLFRESLCLVRKTYSLSVSCLLYCTDIKRFMFDLSFPTFQVNCPHKTFHKTHTGFGTHTECLSIFFFTYHSVKRFGFIWSK